MTESVEFQFGSCRLCAFRKTKKVITGSAKNPTTAPNFAMDAIQGDAIAPVHSCKAYAVPKVQTTNVLTTLEKDQSTSKSPSGGGWSSGTFAEMTQTAMVTRAHPVKTRHRLARIVNFSAPSSHAINSRTPPAATTDTPTNRVRHAAAAAKHAIGKSHFFPARNRSREKSVVVTRRTNSASVIICAADAARGDKIQTAPLHSTIKLDAPTERHQKVMTNVVSPKAVAFTATADAAGDRPETW